MQFKDTIRRMQLGKHNSENATRKIQIEKRKSEHTNWNNTKPQLQLGKYKLEDTNRKIQTRHKKKKKQTQIEKYNYQKANQQYKSEDII